VGSSHLKVSQVLDKVLQIQQSSNPETARKMPFEEGKV
jgi:hypothetical protein